jgi:hypothetical protein
LEWRESVYFKIENISDCSHSGGFSISIEEFKDTNHFCKKLKTLSFKSKFKFRQKSEDSSPKKLFIKTKEPNKELQKKRERFFFDSLKLYNKLPLFFKENKYYLELSKSLKLSKKYFLLAKKLFNLFILWKKNNLSKKKNIKKNIKKK